MSRSKKGSKPPGYEFWGKRRGGGFHRTTGVKQMIHQMERAEAKQELIKAPREPEWDPEEYVDEVAFRCLELSEMVRETMAWDFERAEVWMHADNPFFGGISPCQMIFLGKSQKVRKFIENAAEENAAPR